MFRLEILVVFFYLFDTVFGAVLLVVGFDFFSSHNPLAIFTLHVCVWALVFDVSFQFIKATESCRLAFSIGAAEVKITA